MDPIVSCLQIIQKKFKIADAYKKRMTISLFPQEGIILAVAEFLQWNYILDFA